MAMDVVIREVGLRDGLQSLSTAVTTDRKRTWIREAVGAGVREIEVGSFVPAKLLPQMADTGDVLAFAKTLPGLLPQSSCRTFAEQKRRWRVVPT